MRTLGILLPLLLSLTFTSCASSRAATLSFEAEKQLAQEHYGQAAELFAEASALQPHYAPYHYNSLWASYYAQEYDTVVIQSSEAYQRFPDHLEFLLLKAKALTALAEYELAYTVYEEIFTREEAPEELMVAVMGEAYRLGYSETAAALALELIHHRKHEKEALTLLAEVYPDSWYQTALEYLTHRP